MNKNKLLVTHARSLLALARTTRPVRFLHVKGHSNHTWNDAADQQANDGATGQRKTQESIRREATAKPTAVPSGALPPVPATAAAAMAVAAVTAAYSNAAAAKQEQEQPAAAASDSDRREPPPPDSKRQRAGEVGGEGGSSSSSSMTMADKAEALRVELGLAGPAPKVAMQAAEMLQIGHTEGLGLSQLIDACYAAYFVSPSGG